ncbi:NAD(P)-dependent oxidoreductase [Sphingobium aromaticiconvertens]|uniref:NAD(P)-dependent oxidoreductase n=1 Tax=Sphingobium aromaticiconvertens TaxID=365341 RepID=UPI003016968B
MGRKPVILVVQPLLAGLLPLLRDHYDAIAWWEEGSATRLDEVEALVAAGEFRLEPAWLETMPRLKLIACFTVGYDGVDVGWARSHGIAVAHAQDANGEDVADLAIGLIIAHRRGIVEGDHMVRSGGWQPGPKRMTRSLGGARLGIVGLGGIGMGIARRAEAMRMQVGWWGPRPKPDAPWPRAESLIELARESDILVAAPRAFAGNVGIIDARVMAALGPDGLLVNVSRGQVVDEDALIAALRSGALGGAALDVFWEEPTTPARWVDVPQTVLAPHGGGATDAAVARMTQMLFANLSAHFAGEPLPTPVRDAG